MANAPGELPCDYSWPAGPWVRAMMAMSLDGAVAGAEGRSKAVSGPLDRAVMAGVRDLADAVVIGAGTFRAERYSPMRARAEKERAARGKAEAPHLVIVSQSLDLPWDEPVFHESTFPVVVVTDSSKSVPDFCETIVMAEVTARATVDALRERGLRHVVCEGGPVLLRTWCAEGVVDEIDLTLSPFVIGGGQVSAGAPFPDRQEWTIIESALCEGFLFTRSLRTPDVG